MVHTLELVFLSDDFEGELGISDYYSLQTNGIYTFAPHNHQFCTVEIGTRQFRSCCLGCQPSLFAYHHPEYLPDVAQPHPVQGNVDVVIL